MDPLQSQWSNRLAREWWQCMSPRMAPENERAAITRALTETGGARSTSAERLGMSRTTLWRKMKQYGLEDGDSTEGGDPTRSDDSAEGG